MFDLWTKNNDDDDTKEMAMHAMDLIDHNGDAGDLRFYFRFRVFGFLSLSMKMKIAGWIHRL